MFYIDNPHSKNVGLIRQPTIHYDHAFWASLYDLNLTDTLESPRVAMRYDRQCFNDKAMFSVHLDYLKRLVLLQFEKQNI
jgi:hypothetical protein